MIDKEYVKRIVEGKEEDALATIVKTFLWIGSFVYWCAILIRSALYHFNILPSHRFKQKVISVGNITVGGVGKTPLVEYLAQFLIKKPKKAVILMRGYMSRPGEKSDEEILLKNNLPRAKVLTGKNRIQTALDYLKENQADVFILDDGFQHYQIKRDLDIVVIDSTNPWGEGFLLPAGILRERLTALHRAHIVVLSKTDLGQNNILSIRQKVNEINPKCLIVEAVHQPLHLVDIHIQTSIDLSFIQGKNICVLSAIGAPESFEDLLKTLGATIEESYQFMDHHSFSKKDIENVIQFCKAYEIKTIVTTQKDAVKLEKILNELKSDIQFLYLAIQLKITKGEEEFRGRINFLFTS